MPVADTVVTTAPSWTVVVRTLVAALELLVPIEVYAKPTATTRATARPELSTSVLRR